MIGWDTTWGRDTGERIENGLLDDDLDRLADTIVTRRKALRFPICPACGEPLEDAHQHDDVLVTSSRKEGGT